MELRYLPYSLELIEPFGTAHGVRTSTEGMLVALRIEDTVGYGEVFMPPYYPENQASMRAFFEKIDSGELLNLSDLYEQIDYVNSVYGDNRGAKAALDIALHDLYGKLNNKNVGGIYKCSHNLIPTSYTIGTDTIETMVRKAKAASEFPVLKIKLDGKNDVDVISAIRNVTDQCLYVDANQGWSDIEAAKRTSDELVELGVGLIEQPFPAGEEAKAGELRKSCPVPIVADEDVQSIDDIERLAPHYDGINVKLMKAGGIRAAFKMIKAAHKHDLKVLLGCMTESSIGISAAAQIAHLADWCDLDGNLLIKNDTCTAVETIDGELSVTDAPGIGITDDRKLCEMFGF